jgi:transposase
METFDLNDFLMSGFVVKGVQSFYDVPVTDLNHEGKRVEVLMTYNGNMPTVCPQCGKKLYAHSGKNLTVADVPLMCNPTKLRISIPRRRCSECGYIYQPKVDSIDEKRYMTKRMAAKMSHLALKQSFSDIALQFGVSNNTVKNVFTRFIREKEKELRFETPSFLGLDEIKIKKLGELTVITDLEHKALYDMLKGRNQAALTDYFWQMPNRERVLWVCTDMYRPFEKSIKSAFPNAQWVIDHFHVVAYANLAMDAIRISVQSQMTKNARIATKKGLAYTLRTRARNMKPEEALKIKECRKNDILKPLAVAFDMKEDFFNIWDENLDSIDKAKRAFALWESRIPSDAIFQDFRRLAMTVHNFYEQIFNFWNCPIWITNGFTECTNRLIREDNLRGRGNSFEILRGRTLYRHANLERIQENKKLPAPYIPKTGPVFHYEEVKGVQKNVPENDDTNFNSFDYAPTIGLVPGINFDPETQEIFDDAIMEEWNEFGAQPDTD